MEMTKKQQFINDCLEAMGKDNAGITLFIKMPTGEEEMIHNPNIKAKLDYIESAYDEDLHLKTCPDIQITEYHVHFPMEEVMDFGVALMNLKEGHRVARKSWNGKGIFIQMQFPDENSKMTQPYIYIDTNGLQTSNPDAPKGRVPWLASQTDMLAEDWIIL